MAISPQTPSTAITDAIGQKADMLLVMTVHPGRGGQKFMEECVPKVSALGALSFLESIPFVRNWKTWRIIEHHAAACLKVSELRARFPTKDIQVDGGVGPKTIKPCADAGSNVIVAGTAVFGAPQPKEVIQQLRDAVDQGRKSWPAPQARD